MKTYLLLVILIFSSILVKGQDSLLSKIALENKQIINYKNQKFSGNTLDSLIHKISKHQYVLIGETHHSNEIVHFSEYITKKVNFDNYIMEGNQFITNLINKNLKNPESYLNGLLKQYSDNLGFYTFDKDRAFMESFLKAGKDVIELDQVFLNSDGLLLEELSQITQNTKARKVYQDLKKISNTRWLKYKKNPLTQPPFNEEEIPLMYSRKISEELTPVLHMNISEDEKQIIKDIIKSNEIYDLAKEGKYESHKIRISLMKQNLLDNHNKLKGKRNLFKFGANHVTKYKSLIQDTPDIGNLALNLADAEGEESLHIAIIPKSGYEGSFFGEHAETGEIPYLKIFNDLVQNNEEWLIFDLNKMMRGIKKKKINIESFNLKNLIEGYDYLIVIPEVTAQKKM